jgi:RimJ/RimL family protein N-acetyltransferase
MSDMRHYAARETLRDGTEVTLRAVRPDDRQRIAKAFSGLDRESVYTRFFTFRAELSVAELDRLEAMDFVRDAMLVATIGAGDDETVIGGASFAALAAGDGGTPTAEVAFTVEEDYQGRGIASRMFEHLARLAREKGISRFEADVLAGNAPMLKVLRHSGLPRTESEQDGVVHVTLTLGEGTRPNER